MNSQRRKDGDTVFELILFIIVAIYEVYHETHYTKEQQQIAKNQRETAEICRQRFGGK